jgi:6-phosphogluconolactonase
MTDIEVIADADDATIAAWLETRLAAALAQAPGHIFINVPGGSTPFPIFALMAESQLDWSRIAVWPGDDRIVSEDNPASNIGRIREALEPVGAHIVPLTVEAQPPHFALTWLGMGADGHVASLFPNTDPQPDDPQLVRRITPDPLPPEAPFDRVSLTIPALLDSDELVFVIRGEDKRAVFDAAATGKSDRPVGRLLRAASQKVTCFT